ncbi:MAG: ATP-dependent zinc metalloprotease FtsH [Tistlia sp.]|uniref:ATP-dependent zinc metalloprotease FtsH n=1 Tax=Tistlia sp. TaxID=3057121 RepID=UPI0034A10FED
MQDPSKKLAARILSWALVGLMLAIAFGLFRGPDERATALDLTYSEFKGLVERGQVEAVVFQGDRISGSFSSAYEGRPGQRSTSFTTRKPPLEDRGLLDLLDERGVEVAAEEAGGGSAAWLVGLLPWVLILGVWYFLLRRMSGLSGGLGRGGLGDFLGERTRKVEPASAPKVRFADVAGQDNAKAEVAELLEFLRDPGRYRRLGAQVPHGILLEGPPGTGKTLLAKALAGEAQVPFFHISASEFIEVFVGVGASRVRKLFQDAKQHAPSIIFIDELDSVGRVRGAGFGGGHDEREQTLNQILAEMDGFEGHEAVVVLAATNRPDVLDPALLRPGRFDRHVTLELPDMKARVALLEVHGRDVPLEADVDLERIAAGTPGFSGADLKNLVNEAAMAAARENLERVSARHFDEMRDRIMMGALRTLAIHEDERHRLAVHESGHTAVAYYLPTADPIHKVTIIPRGRSLGSTHQLPEIERHTLPEDFLRDRLAVMLAGRAAEQLFLDSRSSGADEDIRMATQLARWMVGRWGMSEEVGPVDVRDSEEHPFLGREIAQPRHFSEATAASADKAIRACLAEAERRAGELLEAHRPQVRRLIAELEKRETLDRAAVAACLGPKEVAARRKPAPPLPGLEQAGDL